MKAYTAIAVLLTLSAALALSAQPSGMFGDWHTPAGSVIRVEHCGPSVCLRVEVLPPNVPTTDIHNPDPALHGRPICGLEIGKGFTPGDADHASGGTLYDPRTGKTYHGAITAGGAKLRLHGYIGIPLFGASQTWTPAAEPVKSCGAE